MAAYNRSIPPPSSNYHPFFPATSYSAEHHHLHSTNPKPICTSLDFTPAIFSPPIHFHSPFSLNEINPLNRSKTKFNQLRIPGPLVKPELTSLAHLYQGLVQTSTCPPNLACINPIFMHALLSQTCMHKLSSYIESLYMF